MTPNPSIERRAKGRFAPLVPPLMSNVRHHAVKPAMRLVAALMLAAFASIAMAASEGDMRLVGTWSGSVVRPNVTVNGNITFAADGNFRLSAFVLEQGRPVQLVEVEGTWRIDDGRLVEVVTKSTNEELAPVGLASRDRIISLTPESFEIEDDNGRRLRRYRK